MKRIVCVLGMPGSGKTTTSLCLSRILGSPRYHVPTVVGHLLPPHVRSTHRQFGRLFPRHLDALFLQQVRDDPSGTAILDGYPPSPWHMRFLRRHARQYGWRLEVVYLRFPTTQNLLSSLRRQVLRDMSQRKSVGARIFWKLLRASFHLPRVIREAHRAGLPVHVVHAEASLEAVEEQVRSCLGLGLQSILWDREVLQILADLAPDAWVTGGGHVYKPFFNGVFGPMVPSWDVDVRVWGVERAQHVQRMLEARAPHIRWHLKDAESWAEKECGRDLSTPEEAISCMCLICVCVGIRWRNGCVEVRWGHPEAEADLRNGVLRPNPDGQRGFARDKAAKITMYYPGVSAPFINHERVDLPRTFPETVRRLHGIERGGRRQWSGLSEQERECALRVLPIREGLSQALQVVPWPPPAPLPEGDPWFSPDANFRSWVANQTRSRNPVGGRDRYLASALECQKGVAQKPSHQGWSLHLHALHALLQVDTDQLPAFCRPLRLAALWHDVGKIWSIRTPGAHPRIGAKQWKELECDALPGLTLEEAELISFLIANHDIYGRLERGLWDERYQGAMDPSAVRRDLTRSNLPLAVAARLAKELWRADVGSVSMLRWLLPLADPLEELILCRS